MVMLIGQQKVQLLVLKIKVNVDHVGLSLQLAPSKVSISLLAVHF